MRNKKGFTLIELLAVIAIIAIISLVAIPNIVGLSTGARKDQMLTDAKTLISLAKYQISKNYDWRNSALHEFSFDDLNVNGELKKINEEGDVLDPDGEKYDRENSKVVYTNTGKAQYCITLIGGYRAIGISECVLEENLYSRTNVVDRS